MAHLTDLMDKHADNPLAPPPPPGFPGGRVEEAPGPYSMDLREFFVLDYAARLVAHPTLWRAGLDYYATCPRMGRGCLSEVGGEGGETEDGWHFMNGKGRRWQCLS